MKRLKYIYLFCTLLASQVAVYAQTQTLGINQTSSGNPSNNCGSCYTITIAYSISNVNATGTQIKATFNNTIFDVCGYGSYSASSVGTTTTLTFNEGTKAAGTSYTVTYQIKFKPGMACAGLTGTLNATTQTIEHPTPVAAAPLALTATSTETWTITKYIQYGGWIWYQGYTAGSPFNYYVTNCGSPLDAYYHIRVSNGTGCVNLLNSTITDNLPSNATVVDVKDGTLTNIPFTTGAGTVSFNIGNGVNTLDVVTSIYDYYIHVTFPVGDIGLTKCNTATLKGTNACTSTLKNLNSNTECIKLLALTPGNSCGTFSSPYWFGSGYQYFIGCPASLNIGLSFYNQCNPSSLNWNNIGYSTPIPGQIHVDSFGLAAIPAGKWVTITVNTTCGPYTQTFTGPLAATTINFYAPPFNIPGACTISNFAITSNMGINGNNSLSFGQLYFTVLPTTWNTLAPVNVGNTVTMTGATYTTSNGNYNCNPSFVISAKIPKVEVIKSICNENYVCKNENDTINYSIAVRNYGNANLTGASIKDVLPIGLQYVPGSSTFGQYTNPLSTYCNATNQTGTGITIAHAENTSTTNLQWNLPTLTASCNTGSDWLVINFKAKVTNLAPFGLLANTTNCFDASNNVMTETNPWNNTAYINICEKKLALKLTKEVSKDSLVWDSCITVSPGAAVYYRLKVNNPGTVALTQIRIIDLLPNISIAGSDINVIDCNVRGSNMPIYLTNYIPLGSASSITYSTNPQPDRASPADLNIIPNTTVGCATPVTWGIPPLMSIQNQKSLRIDFGAFSLGAGQTETFYYKAQTPPGATSGMIGWNSAGSSAWQGAFQYLGAEPKKVCVTIDSTGCGCIGNFVWFDSNGNGLQDAGEPGINGCTITLYTAANVQVGLPVISANDINSNPGYYSFCGLTAGSYYITVTPPAGYTLTSQNNSNPALNSDVNPNTNTSAVFTFNCQTNNDIDIGLVEDDGCNCNKSTWGDIYISNQVIINPHLGLAKTALPIGDAVPWPGNGTTTKLDCKTNQGPITLKCKTTYNFSAAYNCVPASCGSVSIVVTLPNGSSTTSTGTASFTTNDGGIYTVAIYGKCGTKICDSCKFTFKVVCPVCPCDPKLTVKPSTQSITHVTSAPPYTLLSQNFNITTPPGMLYTQVRAELAGFSLQSGFNNECIACKNLPYTWASIYNASNINTNIAVADSITMGTMPPVIQFTPSLFNTHQNPRETVWSDYNGFTMPASLNLQFILPPKSIITCCTLYGKICVKFTFRDRDCKECEVVVCFNYSIPPTTGHDNPTGGVGTGVGLPNAGVNAATMTEAVNADCKSCRENAEATGSLLNAEGNNPTTVTAVATGQEEITVETLEQQLKNLKELKAKGIKRGDVELIPVIENKIKEIKNRPVNKPLKK